MLFFRLNAYRTQSTMQAVTGASGQQQQQQQQRQQQ